MTEGLPPGPEEMDAAIKPVQDEIFRALFEQVGSSRRW